MQKNQLHNLLFIGLSSFFISATVWITGAITEIPDQFIEPGGAFTTIALKDYLVEGTDCNTFSITPMLTTGTATKPQDCEIYQDYSENMTATVKCAFIDQTFFKHVDDYIIAYDESDNIVACASSSIDPFNVNTGERLFYLTIQGGNTNYPVKIEFYSGEYQQSYTVPAALTYMQDANMGDAANPMVLLVGPLGLQTNANQELSVSVQDSTWRGRQCFTINASDCTGETTGTDQVCFNVQEALCLPVWNLSNTIDGTEIFRASESINATNTINSSASVIYAAGDSVTLKTGFYAVAGSNFMAKIESCTPTPLNLGSGNDQQKKETPGLAAPLRIGKIADKLQLEIAPNPVQYEANIRTFLPKATQAVLMISNQNGQILQQQIIAPADGWQNTIFSTTDLSTGLYFLSLQTATELQVKKLMVVR